jgi:hypothetical protein
VKEPEKKLLLIQCENRALFQSVSTTCDAGGVIRTHASGERGEGGSYEADMTSTFLPPANVRGLRRDWERGGEKRGGKGEGGGVLHPICEIKLGGVLLLGASL